MIYKLTPVGNISKDENGHLTLPTKYVVSFEINDVYNESTYAELHKLIDQIKTDQLALVNGDKYA